MNPEENDEFGDEEEGGSLPLRPRPNSDPGSMSLELVEVGV